MRFILVFSFCLAALPVLAAEWGHYGNDRFGYGIDIPPGYEGQGESANGDGQVFLPASGTATLTVWGGQVLEDDFESEVASRISDVMGDGVNITYQASTPTWASFSGVDGKRVHYLRMIALCDGAQYAAFDLEYATADLAKLEPVVNRLVKSLNADPSGYYC